MALTTPDGRAEVIKTFGDITSFIRQDGTLSPRWEEEKIVRVTLPRPLPLAGTKAKVTRVTCHKLLAPTFRETLKAIDGAGKWSKLVSYGGGFIFRPIRGAAGISLHAWGIAWDFDPDHNQLNTNGRMDRTVVRIFEDHGFFWGGKFQSRKDPMHFQFAVNT
jgi:D-alanyl-D-alanine carboxypeptidase